MVHGACEVCTFRDLPFTAQARALQASAAAITHNPGMFADMATTDEDRVPMLRARHSLPLALQAERDTLQAQYLPAGQPLDREGKRMLYERLPRSKLRLFFKLPPLGIVQFPQQ